jgi:hypothetical protein
LSKYDDIIQTAAQKFNVDPALIRGIIATESSGNPSAKSSVGATGLMQIMPSNYKALGITDPNDPEQNIMGGAKLLSGLLDRYSDVTTALRHYQGGDDTSQWGPVNAAYPAKVFAAGGIAMPKQNSQPQSSLLPGIPGGQSQGNLSDDAILSAFSKGSAPAQSQQQQGPNDDQILAAFTKAGPPGQPTVQPKQTAQAQTTAPQGGEQPNMLESFAAGIGRGAQEIGLGAQNFLGHLLSSSGAQQTDIAGNQVLPRAQPILNAFKSVGDFLTGNANQGLQTGAQQVAPYQAAHPIATGAGDVVGQTVMTAPLLGLSPKVSTLRGAMGLGAAQAGAMGALSPVQNDQDYWSEQLDRLPANLALGAVTPAAMSGIGSLGRYAGNGLASLVRPFTTGGQQKIAEDVLARAARGGPTAIDATSFVPGTNQTLAEATANPGIATLQRTIRDINPTPFVQQEQGNSAARLNALGDIIGTPDDLAAARLARANDAADNYLSTHVGIPTSDTAYAALKQTPAFKKAFASAQEMAQNQGIPSIETTVQNRANANMGGAMGQPQTYVSGRGLQFVKQSLDDQIDSAMKAGESGKARNILGIKDQLLDLMDNNIDGYAQARQQFAAQSGPIDAMQFLQGLNLTDAQGNVTLAKVQSALSNIQKAQQKPGIQLGKSVTDDQVSALQAIRDDLLRAQNTELGKTRAGSASGQNLATQSMLQAALPGKLGALASQLPRGSVGAGIGSLVGFGAAGAPGAAVGAAAGGRIGSLLSALADSKNEAIVDNLTQMLLNPSLAAPALNRVASPALPFAARTGVQSFLTPLVINGGIGMLGNRRAATQP